MKEHLPLLIDVTCCCMEFFTLVIVSHVYLGHKPLPRPKDWIGILLYGIVGALPFLNSTTVALLFLNVSYFFFLYILYEKHFGNALALVALSCSTVLFSQYVVIIVIGIFHLDIYGSSLLFPIVCNFVTLVVVVPIILFLHRIGIYQRLLRSRYIFKILFINTYLVFILFLYFSKSEAAFLYEHPTYPAAILLFLLSANVCLLYYERRLELQEQEISAYKKNLPIYESLIEQIRAGQHEYNNRLQTLSQLPTTCVDYESLCDALNAYAGTYSKPLAYYPLLQLNLPLFSASLYSIVARANDADIRVIFNVQDTKLVSHATETDLSDFACILMQNAVEACTSGDTIFISIRSEEGRVLIDIRNPVDRKYSVEELHLFIEKGYSTKKHSETIYESKGITMPHGYGLYYLHTQLAKYSGSLSIDCIALDDQPHIMVQLLV